MEQQCRTASCRTVEVSRTSSSLTYFHKILTHLFHIFVASVIKAETRAANFNRVSLVMPDTPMLESLRKLETTLQGSFFSTLFLVPKKPYQPQKPECIRRSTTWKGIQTFKTHVKRGDWLIKWISSVSIDPIRLRSTGST